MTGELNRVIEQVSKEKGIDKGIVISAVEEMMHSAARRTFGPERNIESRFNPELGEIELFEIKTVVEQAANPHAEIHGRRVARQVRSRGRDRRRNPDQARHRHDGPDRGAGRQAEPHPAYPRRRAQADLQRVQGSQERSRLGYRAALRAQEHDRQPRPHRGDSARKGADPARALSPERSHPRADRRGRFVRKGPFDHSVAHLQRVPAQAVRAGGARRSTRASSRFASARANRADAPRSRSTPRIPTSIRSALASG